jgi:hypothetical protein
LELQSPTDQPLGTGSMPPSPSRSLIAIIGTILVPRLWADPLGPMLKIWPIIVLHFTALAILENR